VRCVVVVSPAGVSLGAPSGFSPRACALNLPPQGTGVVPVLFGVFLGWVLVRSVFVVGPAGVSLGVPSGLSPRACALTLPPQGIVLDR